MIRSHSGYLTSMLAATLLLSGCSSLDNLMDSVPTADVKVSGEALYRERIMLPPGSTLEIRLEDVSRADAPAELLAQTRQENPGTPPYAFEFNLDDDQFQPGHRYNLRASIRQGEQLMFITDTAYSVDPSKQEPYQLIMRKVAPAPEKAPDATLTNTYWKLVRLNDMPVSTAQGEREAHLIFKTNQRLQGFSGCNQFMGQYTQTGNKIALGPIAGTLRACVPASMYEGPFLKLLQGELDWSVQGDLLILKNAEISEEARFKAVYLQ